jgi:hypothetical protein
MEILGLILFAVGVIFAAIGGLWVVVKAFQTSLIWGLCSLLIPLVALVFAITHWDDCKKPFGIWALGVIMYVGGFLFAADSTDMDDDTTPVLVE